MACKRQEQCKFGKMCGWAEDEETLLTECVEFIEIVPLTNEEWFCQLSTEEKAKIIKMVINTCVSCKEHKTVRTIGCLLRQNMAKGLLFLPCMDEDGICEWLKQPHTEKE